MTDASSGHPKPGVAGESRVGHGPMLAVLLSAMFMAQFDFFVVNVGAPSFVRELHADQTSLELIVGGYAFAYASAMITGGRLGDLYGYRRLFVIGMGSFAFASLLCGIAPSPTQLVLARLLQGFAGALMVPQVLAVITATIPVETRPRALGWYGVAAGVGSLAGQVLGGLLLDANILGLGWRVIFLINVPIGAVAAVLASRLLPRVEPDRQSSLDPLGALGIAIALALLLVPLTIGRSHGWPPWIWICMVTALPVAALTLRWQRALGARGGHPVLDLSLLAVPSYRSGILASVAFMAYFGSFMFTLTLLLQGGLGFTAFSAGLTFAPMGVLFSVSALMGSRLVGRYGLRIVVLGSAVTALGLLLLVLLLNVAQESIGLAWVVISLALVGLGNGVVLPQLIGTALVRVPARQAGIGSGILTTAQQFASSAGVAGVGAVFFAVAGSLSAGGPYARAMEASASIDVVLVLTVGALVGFTMRASDRMLSAGNASG
jgi:EmrB/QacA subfamily drug resistance transporter